MNEDMDDTPLHPLILAHWEAQQKCGYAFNDDKTARVMDDIDNRLNELELLVRAQPLGGAEFPAFPRQTIWMDDAIGNFEEALENAGIDLDVGGEMDDVHDALFALYDAAQIAEAQAIWNSQADAMKNLGADLCAQTLLDFLRRDDGQPPCFGGEKLNDLGREIRDLQERA